MFTPKKLRADYGAYAPAISAEIMELHYTRHYLGYVNNLNAALERHPEWFDVPMSEILERIEEVPEDIRAAVRNNGGGAVNHEIL